jgi:hypothetical protein
VAEKQKARPQWDGLLVGSSIDWFADFNRARRLRPDRDGRGDDGRDDARAGEPWLEG